MLLVEKSEFELHSSEFRFFSPTPAAPPMPYSPFFEQIAILVNGKNLVAT